MDYQNVINKESWEWQGKHHLKNGSNRNMDECMLNGISVTQNEEDMSYMFEDSTPVKACGDLAYYYDDSSEIMITTPQDCKEYTSQAKRRRMLDFVNAADGVSSSFLKSKERIDSFDDIDILSDISQWEASLQDDLCFEDLAQSEAWLADCLVDNDSNIISDEGNASDTSDLHIAVEDCNVAPLPAPVMDQRPVRSSRNIIFKGRKSYMRTPAKHASSVAYPFDFIKPCGVRGDVTLKDINQRILTPPPSKPKLREESVYPTSAFSGKPVVGKTKIPTQGGKGSITIMRTKG